MDVEGAKSINWPANPTPLRKETLFISTRSYLNVHGKLGIEFKCDKKQKYTSVVMVKDYTLNKTEK
jgi:hypothetical protein